jgi:hypothetical protein
VPIVATLLPEVALSEHTIIEPCGSGEVIRALAPTTLFQLPGLRQESFGKMANFARKIPGYRLKLGKDSNELPEILAQFIQSKA